MKDNTVSPKQSRHTKLLFALAILATIISALIGYNSGTQEYYGSLPMGDVRIEEMGVITAVVYGFIVGAICFSGLILYLLIVYLQNSRNITKCANCGITIRSTNDLFCRNCGASLGKHSLDDNA
jgi:hypothetical protein